MDAKVWNDNVHDLDDEFHGTKIFIKAGEHVTMNYDDAMMFKGQYKTMVFTADGAHDSRGFKKVRVERILAEEPAPEAVSTEFVCQACNYNALSKWDLEGHVNELHLDTMADAKEAEKRRAKKGK